MAAQLFRLRALSKKLPAPLCLWALVGWDCVAHSGDELRARFGKEASARWKEYADWCKNLEGTGTVIATKGETTEDHERFEYKYNAACRLIIRQSLLKPSGTGEVAAFNRRYAFLLERKTSEKPWVLKGIGEAESKNAAAIRKDVEKRSRAAVSLLLTWPDSLEELTTHPSFRILRATPVTRFGSELVQLEFENPHEIIPAPGEPFVPIQSGVLLLDPERFWIFRGGDFNCNYSDAISTVKIEIELADSKSRFPIPKRRVTTIASKSLEGRGSYTRKMVSDFHLSEPSTLPPDEQFTLSAFGVPEPFAVAPARRYPWFLWAGIAGVLCVIVGVFFARRGKVGSKERAT